MGGAYYEQNYGPIVLLVKTAVTLPLALPLFLSSGSHRARTALSSSVIVRAQENLLSYEQNSSILPRIPSPGRE